jgi:hypothetical protein
VSQSEFTLRDGRSVHLLELRQSRTYEGLREGFPTKESNASQLNHLVESVSASYPTRGRPLLLPCAEVPLSWDQPKPYAFGVPAKLPEITCIGRFGCREAARDGDWSELVVIWLQNDFALPIEQTALQQLLEVDWVRLATDFDW